jgi:septum formation protein
MIQKDEYRFAIIDSYSPFLRAMSEIPKKHLSFFIVGREQDCQFVLLLVTVTFMEHERKNRIILASKSPRRRDLLAQAGLTVTVIPSTVDEKALPPDRPADHVRILAAAKAKEVATLHPDHWIVGADTEVTINGRTLGKPRDEMQARNMLRILSGKVHTVFTGYCICCMNSQQFFAETVATNVRFKHLTEKEIDWYVSTREPYDKAGGYAIQGLGTVLVKSIEGSYTNVVGLPVCEVVACLIKAGVVSR